MHRDRDAVVTRTYVEAGATNDADDRVVDGDGEWLPGGDVDRLAAPACSPGAEIPRSTS